MIIRPTPPPAPPPVPTEATLASEPPPF